MNYDFYEYESVQSKKKNALKNLKKYQKKHPNAQPVQITGTKIATSFWGKAWCDNLKYYADYDNRVSRGRSYIKNGFILDLTIEKGCIHGVVSGSRSNVYQVEININPLLNPPLLEKMSGKLENLEELARGQFPEALAEVFLTTENGLFPNLKEIQLDCNCPDWAHMCKHVSAILYAVGAKLDQEPLLLFKLRGIDTQALIKKSVEEKMTSLLKNAQNVQSNRVIEDEKIFDLFNL